MNTLHSGKWDVLFILFYFRLHPTIVYRKIHWTKRENNYTLLNTWARIQNLLPVLSTLFENLDVKHFGKPTQKGLAFIRTQNNSISLLEKIVIFVGNQKAHLVGRVRWAQGLKVQRLDERRRTMKWLNESSVLNRQLFLQRDEASSQNSRDWRCWRLMAGNTPEELSGITRRLCSALDKQIERFAKTDIKTCGSVVGKGGGIVSKFDEGVTWDINNAIV